MKLKTKFLALTMAACLVVPQIAFGSELDISKKAELERILSEAESKGVVIDQEVENIDYETLDLEKIESTLQGLSSIPKEIVLTAENSQDMSSQDNISIAPRMQDESVKSLYAQYLYYGKRDILGKGYNYQVIIHIDYDCLFDHNGRPVRIEHINDSFAVGTNLSLGVNFTQSGSIIPTYGRDNSYVKLRGKGRFTVGIEGLGGAHYDVEYSCTAHAGDNGYQ